MDSKTSWSPEVYGELRRLARAMMGEERGAHTLEPTALAHEVWLRLLRSRNAAGLEYGEFLGTAAQAMRRILTDHARRRGAAKRGGGLRRTTLAGKAFELRASTLEPCELALDLDAALAALAQHDAELVRLVELRFYAGASTEEIAAALGISERTLKRRWRFARAWLQQHILEDD